MITKEVICSGRTTGYYLSKYCQSECTHADYHKQRHSCHDDGFQCTYTGLWCYCK